MNEIIKEAKNFAKSLDDASDEALKRAKQIVMMDLDPEHPQLHRLMAVQIEAAKLILVSKLKYSGSGDDGNEVMNKLFESFKVEYKQTATIVSKRPETLPSKLIEAEK